jgi:hypothetical protein
MCPGMPGDMVSSPGLHATDRIQSSDDFCAVTHEGGESQPCRPHGQLELFVIIFPHLSPYSTRDGLRCGLRKPSPIPGHPLSALPIFGHGVFIACSPASCLLNPSILESASPMRGDTEGNGSAMTLDEAGFACVTPSRRLEDSAGAAGLKRKDPRATQRGWLSTVLSCIASSWRLFEEEIGEASGRPRIQRMKGCQFAFHACLSQDWATTGNEGEPSSSRAWADPAVHLQLQAALRDHISDSSHSTSLLEP